MEGTRSDSVAVSNGRVSECVNSPAGELLAGWNRWRWIAYTLNEHLLLCPASNWWTRFLNIGVYFLCYYVWCFWLEEEKKKEITVSLYLYDFFFITCDPPGLSLICFLSFLPSLSLPLFLSVSLSLGADGGEVNLRRNTQKHPEIRTKMQQDAWVLTACLKNI